MSIKVTSKPLPNGRVREFGEIPGEVFFFEPGDVARYRDEEGPVVTADGSTRQLRLDGWERTRFVSWEKCHLVKSRAEVNEPEPTPEPEPKKVNK